MEQVRIIVRSLTEVDHPPEVFFERLLAANWCGVVGPRIGGQTLPGTLRAGCLTVYVRNSTWFKQLQGLEDEIAARIRAGLGRPAVARVRLVSRPSRFRSSPQPVPSPPDAPPAGESGDVAVADRSQPDLRRQFEQARQEHLRLWRQWRK
jgi:hypothetical protein